MRRRLPVTAMGSGVVTLGLGGATHDFTAALAVDGRIVVAIAEERLTREKHAVDIRQMATDFESPAELQRQTKEWLQYVVGKRPFEHAVAYVLEAAGVAPGDIALVGHCCDRRLLPEVIQDVPQRRFNHHLAHAASSFLASPFTEAAVIVADGAGDRIRGSTELEATSVYHGHGAALDCLWRLGDRHSIGGLYEAATALVGFHPLEEGKTMALASFGSDRFCEPVRSLVELHADGRYSIGGAPPDPCRRPERVSKVRLLLQATGLRRPLDDDAKADLARAVQDVTELVLLHLSEHLVSATGAKCLCIAGGVGLNSVANHRLLQHGEVRDLFVQPFAGDGGLAIGTALLAARLLDPPVTAVPMRSAFLGRPYSDAEIAAAIRGAGDAVHAARHADIEHHTARLLADGRIVGWFQDGAEWGPRALGNRSILADPRDAESKHALDQRVKLRETFRPYAPAVLYERQDGYFALAHESPFMLLVAPVRSERAAVIPAVVHVDGTARLQTVKPEICPRFARLITEFEALTGVPVLLNTSFNLHGEPIVETPDDAVRAFLGSGMDSLVLGDFAVERAA